MCLCLLRFHAHLFFNIALFLWFHVFPMELQQILRKKQMMIRSLTGVSFEKSKKMKIYPVVCCGWSVLVFTCNDQKMTLELELYIKKFCREISLQGISPSVKFQYKHEIWKNLSQLGSCYFTQPPSSNGAQIHPPLALSSSQWTE